MADAYKQRASGAPSCHAYHHAQTQSVQPHKHPVLLLLLILPAAKGLSDLWETLHCLSAWFGGESRHTNQTRTPAAHPKVQAHTCKKTWTEALLPLGASAQLHKNLH